MATYATLTINAADIIGENFDRSRASVWVEANTEHGLIVVDGTSVRVGGRRENLVDGVATFELVTTNSADNPTSFGYRVTIVYVPKGSRKQGHDQITTSDFPLTASANLAAIPEAWDNVTAPVSWRSEFMDSASAVATAAAASATSAAASASLAQSIALGDAEATLASAIVNPGPVRDNLSATIEAGSAPRTTPTRHAPALNLYFPEAEGADPTNPLVDDTAAIQAAFAAAPAGATVWLQPTGWGAYYGITDTITITKPSQRLAGPGRDAYASSIRCAVAGKAMLHIKAPGFVLDDVGLIGDSSAANGAGATVTGLELWGDTDGNIDARILGTFQGLAVAARTRGRNATFMPSTLVSNCLDGIIIDGKDATYHTGPNASENRGNRIDLVRFHNIGTAAANAAIKFTTTSRVQHAVVSGCHFDSKGEGRHIVAEGTSANPLSKIMCVGNKHTEMRAAAYDFTYVNNSRIALADMSGDTELTTKDYNGINANNCDTLLVADVFGLQLGTSGIYARNCLRLRVRGADFRALGFCSTTTGHGFDIDATNAGCEFDNLAVEGTDGYGFTGSPTTSRMGSYEFTSCTAGRFDSTVFGPPVVTIPAQDMTAITGTPNLGGLFGIGYPEAYHFDPAATEQIVAQFPDIPDDWKTFDVVLWWAPVSTAAGNVVWQSNLSWMTPGAVPSADTVALGNDIGAAPGVQGQVVETVVYTNLPRKNAAALIRVVRVAADASDTYAADAALIAVRLVRAS